MKKPAVYAFPMVPVRSWSALVSDSRELDQVMAALAADPLEAEDLAAMGETPPHSLEDFADRGPPWTAKALQTISEWIMVCERAPSKMPTPSIMGQVASYSPRLAAWCCFSILQYLCEDMDETLIVDAFSEIRRGLRGASDFNVKEVSRLAQTMRISAQRARTSVERYQFFCVFFAMSLVILSVEGDVSRIDEVAAQFIVEASLCMRNKGIVRRENDADPLLAKMAADACFTYPARASSGAIGTSSSLGPALAALAGGVVGAAAYRAARR